MQPFLNQKGQSLIEIALVVPLLLIVLYVPFDFGMTIYAGYLTQNAVRDGARIASRTRSAAGGALDNSAASAVADQVWARLPNLLNEPTKQVTVRYYSGAPADCAAFVEVTAGGTYNFTLYKFMKLFGLTAPDTLSITRTTRMRYEFQAFLNGGATGAPTFCSTGSPTASGTHT
jgi:Flp pilus assembly protein TadG